MNQIDTLLENPTGLPQTEQCLNQRPCRRIKLFQIKIQLVTQALDQLMQVSVRNHRFKRRIQRKMIKIWLKRKSKNLWRRKRRLFSLCKIHQNKFSQLFQKHLILDQEASWHSRLMVRISKIGKSVTRWNRNFSKNSNQCSTSTVNWGYTVHSNVC